MLAILDMTRRFGKFERVEADTPGYSFSSVHLATPRSHAALEIEVNSDSLVEIEDIAKCAVSEEFPGWELNYVKIT